MDLSLLEKAKALPLEERVVFVQALWDSLIQDGYEPALSVEEAAELDRRLMDHADDPSAVIPWSELRITKSR